MKIVPAAMKTDLMIRAATKPIARAWFLPLRDRIQNDGGSDVRDDQEELQENRQVHDVVLAVLGDVRGWADQDVLEEDVGEDRL